MAGNGPSTPSMPASRWTTDPAELMKWLAQEENKIKETFSDMILQFMADQQATESNIGGVTDIDDEPINTPIYPRTCRSCRCVVWLFIRKLRFH